MFPSTSQAKSVGIAALGLSFPRWAMTLEELAVLRGVDPAKYTLGLGCREMALCSGDDDVVSLAVTAAERALERWGGDRDRLGLIVVGTESAVDMSRPLSAWVADRLGLRGAVRSYEVKHACYGGTLALRQACEWKMAGVAGDRAALVIAADVALYAPEDPGEPTQGAGAVAMVVDEASAERPLIAGVEPESFPWSEPVFDFWRPVGESFPRVEGQLSLDCYKRAAERCFAALVAEGDADAILDALAAVCFHVPFPKMVKKAVFHVGESLGWDPERCAAFYERKVVPTMAWNTRCGNAYTASLWISVAQALRGLEVGRQIAAFSYGSGFGAELLTLTAGPGAREGAWEADALGDFAVRTVIDAEQYEALRRGYAVAVA